MKLFNPEQVKQRFNRIAKDYDQHAVMCQEIGERLLERLAIVKIKPETVVDLGAGTGYFIPKLQKIYPDAKIIAVDFAKTMLAQITTAVIQHQTHASVLPFPDNSIDFIFSNLMLPWCDNLPSIFQEVSRVLKPDGLFFFTSFGPDSFKELHATWAAIDDKPHAHYFYDMHDIGDALAKAALADVVMEVEHLQLTYPSSLALVKELKAIGFSNVLLERAKGLLGKNKWQTFLQTYPCNEQGRAPLTLEVVYGHAWGRELKQAAEGGVNEATISLDQLYQKIR